MNRTRFQEAVVDAVRDIAPPVPAHALERIRARRAAGERIILPVAGAAAPRHRPLSRAALIAGGSLLVAAAAAAALPGSPVREWLARQFAESAPPPAPSAPRAPAAPLVREPAAAATDTLVASVSIPVAESLWVRVADLGTAQLILAITEAPALEVRALAGAATATFSPRTTGVSVTALSGGTLHVDVPAEAGVFDLYVGRRAYARKRGTELRILAPADSSGGRFVFRR